MKERGSSGLLSFNRERVIFELTFKAGSTVYAATASQAVEAGDRWSRPRVAMTMDNIFKFPLILVTLSCSVLPSLSMAANAPCAPREPLIFIYCRL